MSRYWSALRRRLAIASDVHARGGTLLFVHSFLFALALPVLLLLPLPRLQALLDRLASRRRRQRADKQSVAATVLAMLQAGGRLIRPGCLTRGITLYYFLRRAGVEVDLCFGIGRVSEGDGFDGHCWLSIDGEPYLETRDPRPLYTGMYAFRGSSQSKPSICSSPECENPR